MYIELELIEHIKWLHSIEHADVKIKHAIPNLVDSKNIY